jgi:uncharacterized protein (DUF58 family)
MRIGSASAAGESGFIRHSRRSYHLHPPGIAYLVTTFFLAIGGFNSQNNLLFWAFGLGVAGLIVSGIVSGAPLMRLELSRRRVGPVSVGERIRVEYRIRNTGRVWPAFALEIDEFAGRRGRGWVSALRTGVAHVGPRETATAGADAVAQRRGVHELRTVRVSTTFPLGLVRKCLYFDLPAQVTVRPRVRALRRAARARLVPGFEHTAGTRNRVGGGDEFYALREYQPGDPMRRIAWRASARSESLMVRQNAAPAPPRLRVRLDPPGPGVSEDAFENTLSLVASIVVAAARERLAPGLDIPWAGVSLPPADGAIAAQRALDALARVERGHPPPGGAAPASELVVTFEPAGGGALCGADPERWAAEPGPALIEPAPARRRGLLRRRARGEVAA